MKKGEEIGIGDDLNYPKKIKHVLKICLEHSSQLLDAAKTVLEKDKLPNIAYHLATLALEEVGKAEIVRIRPFKLEEKVDLIKNLKIMSRKYIGPYLEFSLVMK